MNGGCVMLYKINASNLFDLTLFGRLKYKKNWGTQYRHRRNVMLFMLKGEFVLRLNESDELISVKAGEYIIIPARTIYKTKVNEDCDYYYAHFDTVEPITQIDKETVIAETNKQVNLQTNKLRYRNLPPMPKYLYIASHMTYEKKKEAATYELSKCENSRNDLTHNSKFQLNNDFFKIMLLLASITNETISHNSTMPPSLVKIISFIHQNYNTVITSKTITDNFGYSQQYVSRLFKKHLGRTVTQYINFVKMQNSIELLRYTDLNIGEIAYSLGYSSAYYFCRVFKQEFNITPTEYQLSITYKNTPQS